MKISECMTRGVKIAGPGDTIRAAAKMMAECDAGSLPVGENDRLIGMITDRDITIRAVAEGKGPDTLVRDTMSGEIRYCFEDDECEDVLNREKRLTGIVSLSDLATKKARKEVGEALKDISRPGGQHSQAAH